MGKWDAFWSTQPDNSRLRFDGCRRTDIWFWLFSDSRKRLLQPASGGNPQ